MNRDFDLEMRLFAELMPRLYPQRFDWDHSDERVGWVDDKEVEDDYISGPTS